MIRRKLGNNELFIATTDTVIGLGGKLNDVILEKIYEVKQRDRSKKIIIVVGSLKQLEKLETLTQIHYEFINKYWPGNTTLIINNQAYRMPNNKKLIKFIKKEGPFYLTSANISNHSTIKSIEDASDVFPGIRCFDFGKGSGEPSHIIDIESGKKIR